MHVLVAGVSHMSGVSQSGAGNKYDMKRITLLAEQAPVDTAHRVLSSVGLNAVDMNLSEDCYLKFESQSKTLKFPIMMDLEDQTDISSGQPRATIVDFKVSQPPKPLGS
jgi:hypothetical protein